MLNGHKLHNLLNGHNDARQRVKKSPKFNLMLKKLSDVTQSRQSQPGVWARGKKSPVHKFVL